MKVDVENLRSNPFRNLKRLPLDPEKVSALTHSIKDTTFWDNLIGRKGANGGVEIAYGHHRVAALKKCGIETIDMNVRPLTDTAMVKIMSHENMGEWSHDAEFETETVRSTLEAAAEGRIELPEVTGKYGINNARFLDSARADSKYTAATLASFLGWQPYKVEAALAIIESEQEGTVSPETVRGLSTRQAEAVVTQVRRVSKSHGKATARAIGKTLAAGMRKGSGGRYKAKGDSRAQSITIHNAKSKADELVGDKAKPPKTMPDINAFSRELAKFYLSIFSGTNRMKIEAVSKHCEYLEPERRRELRKALETISNSALKFKEELQ